MVEKDRCMGGEKFRYPSVRPTKVGNGKEIWWANKFD